MNSLELWRQTNPWRGLSNWSRVMDRIFEDTVPANGDANWFNPAAKVEETPTHYEFSFNLPGVKKEEVKIELHKGQLTVAGERREEKRETSKRQHVLEQSYGSFYRAFQLPQDVNAERVEAKFENGVLHITVAKGEEAKARQITVK